ncbi:MAG: 1,2-dihydroxy-3-keto-5-methylthiopentene dioxygenase [Oceanococcus sp.]
MTTLKIFADTYASKPQSCSSHLSSIQNKLGQVGVRFERWHALAPLPRSATAQQVAQAYGADIQRLIDEQGYQSWDVVSMHPKHPDKAAFRQMFLAEHRHGEDEVRFFVRGQGLFTLHIDGRIFEVLCQQGDLIGVPAHTPHWFDMGPNPNFDAIRLFNNPAGWVAKFTGSDIAKRFSQLDN